MAIDGDNLNNNLIGTIGANITRRSGGNDLLQGQAGDDVLNGGVRLDSLYGGTGLWRHRRGQTGGPGGR